MDTAATIRLLRTILSGPDTGRTPIPFLGTVSSVIAHRLCSVSLPHSAIMVVLSGEKTVICGEEQTVVKTGEAFLYPACTEAIIVNDPDPATGWYIALCLTIEEEMLARVASTEAVAENTHFSLGALSIPCDEILETSLNHLLRLTRSSPDNERLLALCREELLLLFSERIDCLPLLWHAATTWSSRCSGLVSMEPGREWSTDIIAAKLGTSERSLRRHLNGEGTNLRRIMQDVRLNSGLALLQSGATSVGETAYRCGYNSASRFAGLFRERFGVSPSEVLQYNAVLEQPLAGS